MEYYLLGCTKCGIRGRSVAEDGFGEPESKCPKCKKNLGVKRVSEEEYENYNKRK